MKKVILRIELSQAEALALQNALDAFVALDNSEPEKDMIDKVSEALTKGGYDADKASLPV